MKRIGLTGGIGSGKTYVAQRFAARGIPVFYADAAARELQDHDPALRAAIAAAFGPEAYTPAGLNRPWLAAQVFSDPEALARLNALVHPRVHQAAADWFAAQATGRVPFALYESAILFETGRYEDMDGTILVTAPEAVRIARVTARDGVDEAAVRARMARQWPDERKRPLADFVIVNDGQAEVDTQVAAVLRHFGAADAGA